MASKERYLVHRELRTLLEGYHGYYGWVGRVIWIYRYVMSGPRLHQVLGKGYFNIMEGIHVQME